MTYIYQYFMKTTWLKISKPEYEIYQKQTTLSMGVKNNWHVQIPELKRVEIIRIYKMLKLQIQGQWDI